PVGNAIRVGDLPQDLNSLSGALALDPGESILGLTFKDSGYGYGSVQRIEVTLANGKIWSAGVDGGRATCVPCKGQCLVGFYGSANIDNFVNSLGAYLRSAQ